MKSYNYRLKFVTPALLTGANQGKAEIRSASIIGQLRWWFRIMGGTLEQEQAVFGGISGEGDSKNLASSLIVRVSDIVEKHSDFPRAGGLSPYGYLSFFATRSGEPKGIRIKPDAFWAEGTEFSLNISVRKSLDPQNEKLLESALFLFTTFGSLGFRATRGFGALQNCETPLTKKKFIKICSALRNYISSALISERTYDNSFKCLSDLGQWLKAFRKTYRLSGNKPSALGYTDRNKRESSALHLRPVRVQEGYLPLMFYTDKACSQESIKDKLRDYANLL